MTGAKGSTRSPEAEETSLDPELLNPSLVSPKENGELGITEVRPMLKPRAYQEEMLVESLRQNIVIAVSSPWLTSEVCS